jgi:hypothetical protein
MKYILHTVYSNMSIEGIPPSPPFDGGVFIIDHDHV